jgi:sigma-54 dependent transcriptional regulator of gfr operon
MDQGVFRRVGESDGWHKVNVRLIMATTENLSTSFLETFLRRIPLQMKIPSLEKRGYKEKLQLIYLFFLKESRILDRELIVSEKVLQALISSNKDGNVGALENLVKIICGTAYSHQQSKDTISVKLPDVPEDVLYKNNSRDKFTKELKNIMISPQMSLHELYDIGSVDKSDIDMVFHNLESVLTSKNGKEIKVLDCEHKILQIVESFFSNIGRITIAEEEQGLMKYLVESMQEVSRYMEDNYNVRFKGNSIYDIATYLYYRINESRNQIQYSEQYTSLIKILEDYCRDQIPMVKKISSIIESNIDVGLNNDDIILFSLYLKSLLMKGVKGHSRGIIIAHGNTTAKSISNAVNDLLGKDLFDFIDIPIEGNDEEIVNSFIKFSKDKNTTKGIIILTDFVLSNYVCRQLGILSNGQVLILNNISTDFAFIIGKKLKDGADLHEIIEFYSKNYKISHNLIYPTNKMSKCLISCCITGIGASEPIRQMLQESLPKGVDITVISEDYETLLRKGKDSSIFNSYDVLGIVGTVNPRVKDITYISLEELILGESTDKIKDMLFNTINNVQLSEFQHNLFINFSLENLMKKLVVLDANKLISDVEECINRYIDITGIEFSNRKRISILFHVCCMTERLVRRMPIEKMIEEEEDIILQREKQEMLTILQRAFSIIEKNYNVNVPLCEWNNIMDIIIMDYN